MQRQNTGLVNRTSVLTPGSDGIYVFQNTAIRTHPGIVLGYFNLRNIRDAPRPTLTLSGIDFAPILYDADVEVSTAAGPLRFPVLDHEGFIVLTKPALAGTPATPAFGPDEYSQLVSNNAAHIGGPVNQVITSNNLTMSITSISVGVTVHPSTNSPEFVVTANVTTMISGNGEWSWLQINSLQDPTVAPPSGIPVIREGAAGSSSAPTPLRFADPEDLLDTSPNTDYALMHAGPNQRVLFPRPKIEADGRNEISSELVPQIADPYAMSTANGPFPSPDFTIPLENVVPPAQPTYRIAIDANGHLRLVFSDTPFQATKAQRTLYSPPDLQTVVHTETTLITLKIDGAASPAWTFEMTNVDLATETSNTGDRQELQRVVASLVCSPTGTAEFRDAQLQLGPPLQPMKDVLSFFQALGAMPPLQLSMTND